MGSESKVEEDEYKTPEERRMDAFEEKLAALGQNTNANTLASGRQVLQGHMETVFGEYNFLPEDAEKMRTAMTTQFDSWAGLGAAGESALKSVMSMTGENTVRGIMLSSITPEALRAAAVNTTSAKRSGLAGLATDGPSGSASTGMEAPSSFENAKAAADYARANPGGHDSY
jgi:hypothetical protein